MKPIKIECPSCQQHIEINPPDNQSRPSNRIGNCLLAVIAAGVGFMAWMQWNTSRSSAWDYDVQNIENDAHQEYNRYITNANNRDLAPITLEEPGYFQIESTVFSNRLYGWDFITAIPEIETTYPPGRPGGYVRTGKIALLFRRPK
jgi:hypothetical protein